MPNIYTGPKRATRIQENQEKTRPQRRPNICTKEKKRSKIPMEKKRKKRGKRKGKRKSHCTLIHIPTKARRQKAKKPEAKGQKAKTHKARARGPKAKGPKSKNQKATGQKAKNQKAKRQRPKAEGQRAQKAKQNKKSPGQASARAAATSRTGKAPIRGQKVQLGPFLERGNARGLLHSYLQRIPYLRGNTPN